MPYNPLVKIQSPILYPEIIEKGKEIKVLDTHVNLEWLLDHFHAEIRYNLMLRRREITIPNYNLFTDDEENSGLALIDHIAILNGMPNKRIDLHLDTIAQENPYHPIVECIRENKWDGAPRLEKFIDTLDAENPQYAKKVIRTWMVCAMAAAHSQRGFINNGVLVLQGSQNIGKTRWVKSLDPINCNAVKEGAFLDPSNKDSVSQLASYWIAELGELDSIFKKSEIGRLKSFITMEADCVRLPYARKPIRLARRTAYVATVNDANFLIDETGNRRWWTIVVNAIDLNHGLDMSQVWAEVYHLWQEGHLTYLNSDLQNEVNESNKSHERVDPLKEKLLSHYDWNTTARKSLTATAILEELGYTKPSRSDATAMGKLLAEINQKDGRKTNGLKVHEVPAYLLPKNSIKYNPN